VSIEKMGSDPAIEAAKKAAQVAKKELGAAKEGLKRAGEDFASDMGNMIEGVKKDVSTITDQGAKLRQKAGKNLKEGAADALNSSPVNAVKGLGEVGAGVVTSPFDKKIGEKLGKVGIDDFNKAFTLDNVVNVAKGPGKIALGAGEGIVSVTPYIAALPAGAIEAALGTTVVTAANAPELARNLAKVIGKEFKLGVKEVMVLEKQLEFLAKDYVKGLASNVGTVVDFLKALNGAAKENLPYLYYTAAGLGIAGAAAYAIKKFNQ